VIAVVLDTEGRVIMPETEFDDGVRGLGIQVAAHRPVSHIFNEPDVSPVACYKLRAMFEQYRGDGVAIFRLPLRFYGEA
jgi:hypothetical protein